MPGRDGTGPARMGYGNRNGRGMRNGMGRGECWRWNTETQEMRKHPFEERLDRIEEKLNLLTENKQDSE